MFIEFTEEQKMIKDQARSFFTKECDIEWVRKMWDTPEGITDETWAKITELGWPALLIPEEYDGMGLSLLDACIVMEEMGRAVMTGPFFSTVILGGETLRIAGSDEQKSKYLPKVAAGECKLTLAIAESDASFEESGINLIAEASGDGYTLNGAKLFVLDAHLADAIIVVGRTGRGISLFIVEKGADGLSVKLEDTIDMGRKLCTVDLKDVKVGKDALVGSDGEGWAAVDEVMDRARVALCFEMVGVGERAMQITIEYANQRMAFGVPIGSYQAIKHKLADMVLLVESSRSAAYHAAWAVDEPGENRAKATSIAKAFSSDMARITTGDSIQAMGAIGFTWEHDLHLYFKRAKFNELFFGDASYHRERVMKLVEGA